MTFSPELFPVIFYGNPCGSILLHDIQAKLLSAHRLKSVLIRTKKDLAGKLDSKCFSCIVTGVGKKTPQLLSFIREKKRFLPVILLGKTPLLAIPEESAEKADAYFVTSNHTAEALAHRIAFHAEKYLKNLYPDPLERNLLFPWTDLRHEKPRRFRYR